jgi:prephenate dehydrogenase
MLRVLKSGRAGSREEALEAVKEDLRALNSSVTVSKEEHDEVAAVKPLFMECGYMDELSW